MKILHYSFYVSVDNDSITRRKTGYGYMVMDIINSIKKKNSKIYVLTSTGITSERKIASVEFISNKWVDFFSNMRFFDLVEAIKVIITNKVSFHESIRIFYSSLQRGYFNKVAKSYDILHFHGVGPTNIDVIKDFVKQGRKVIVTLHGLNSFDPIVNVTDYANKVEKDFLLFASEWNVPVSVISSGVKNEIERYLKGVDVSNFVVITNGTSLINEYSPKVDIRKKHSIPKKAKIAICVGNICERKNQIEVVEAYNTLESLYQEDLYIIFLGNEFEPYPVSKRVKELKFEDKLIFAGAIPKEEMPNYYLNCDFTILASISEGFGLSIIEGFQYGKPSLTYSDIDAIDDIYSDCSIIKIESRSSESLANGIKAMLDNEWENDKIIEHSERFSLSKMADKYMRLYNEVR
ncbi:glycosyltransferase family 4 protein [Photobacterium sp. J15]|uniref:glycosyltransferase family 4 protein n=1 Tax=Photobacterium sp. J15 TaxID=265901 RepID=UPI0012EE2795|nr:glycosyltransferase family 4 protein [Photobacterium sp. J15]